MDSGFILRAEKLTVHKGTLPILQDISFLLRQGDHLAVTGASGSGKTTLGLALAGKIFYKGEIHISPALRQNITWVEQQHHFKNNFNTSDLYYQQRFNSYDSEETKTARQALTGNDKNIDAVLETMKISYLAEKPLIQLSNGENKKLQIAGALLSDPSVLIFDQPFVGLDKETRAYLHDLMNKLANQNILIILITTPDEIPVCITKVLRLEKGRVTTIEKRKTFLEKHFRQAGKEKESIADVEKRKALCANLQPGAFHYAIRMKNVNVQYEEKKILMAINWEVKKGERWLLSGPNGAGKTTLLSLVTADNPQAYANEIYLFDKKRGSGESIWDIKRKVGYLSPELHLFFDQTCNCFEAVASGLFDTIGLFRQLSEKDIQVVNNWIEITGIERIKQKRLYELSTGEQRMVLLARALVKDPPLLILDEPCQGIDAGKQAHLLDLINTICLTRNKTMVFVTHYDSEKPGCIDHIIKLDGGKIVEAGPC